MSGDWLLVRSARQLITLRGVSGPRSGAELRELGVVANGALLIRDDQIMAVGPTRRIENLKEARTAKSIDATGRVVMPVFADSEVQLLPPPSMDPSGADSAEPHHLSAKSASRLETDARALLDRMVRHGTGRIEALTVPAWHSVTILKALRMVEAAAMQQPPAVTSTLLAAPTVFGSSDQNELFVQQFCTDLLPVIARRKLARLVAVSTGPRHLSDSQNQRILAASRAVGLRGKVICDGGDPADALRLSLEPGVVSISGFRSPAVQLRHSAPPGCMMVLTCPMPGEERQEAARAAVDEGFAITLATGFQPHMAGSYSMQHALAAAVKAMRLDPAEAITAATINAAFHHGAGAETGSLEPGKRADFILLNMSDYHELFAGAGVNALHLMACAGRLVYQEADVLWR